MAAHTEKDRESIRILIMDDEEMIRDVFCDGLRLFGYTVAAVNDGAAAVADIERMHAAGTPYHIVFLDLTIRGGIGGKEAISQIRRRFSDLPVVAVSGDPDDPVIVNHGDHGFSDSLAKPFTIETLIAAVRRFVPA